jgi:hypothetical protein
MKCSGLIYQTKNTSTISKKEILLRYHCEPPSAAKQSLLFSVIPVKTGIQFLYLNSSLGSLPYNGHSGTAEEFTLPCHSEPQAKNLLTLRFFVMA